MDTASQCVKIRHYIAEYEQGRISLSDFTAKLNALLTTMQQAERLRDRVELEKRTFVNMEVYFDTRQEAEQFVDSDLCFPPHHAYYPKVRYSSRIHQWVIMIYRPKTKNWSPLLQKEMSNADA